MNTSFIFLARIFAVRFLNINQNKKKKYIYIYINQLHLKSEAEPSDISLPGPKTHHTEVFRSALGAVEVAGQQHVFDVVTRAVVKLPHVEGTWFEVVEVGFDLQALQHALLHEVDVPDLMPDRREEKKSVLKSAFILNANLTLCNLGNESAAHHHTERSTS